MSCAVSMQVISNGTLTPNYKILCFCNTARAAGFLAEFFRTAGVPHVLEIHSRMSQTARTKASDAFRNSKGGTVMFTSDVSARGVDYKDTSTVIQAGLPADRDTYIHRLGRTARGESSGEGIILLCDYEAVFLKKLKDLPVQKMALDPLPEPQQAQWFDAVQDLTGKMQGGVRGYEELTSRAEKMYVAWIGYMKTHAKLLGWKPADVVAEANHMAGILGLPEIPAIEKKTIGKMGMKGVPGIKIAAFQGGGGGGSFQGGGGRGGGRGGRGNGGGRGGRGGGF